MSSNVLQVFFCYPNVTCCTWRAQWTAVAAGTVVVLWTTFRGKHFLRNCVFRYPVLAVSAFTALTVLVGWQEGHSACKRLECWYVGGDDLTESLHILKSSRSHHPLPSYLAAAKSRMGWHSSTSLPGLSLRQLNARKWACCCCCCCCCCCVLVVSVQVCYTALCIQCCHIVGWTFSVCSPNVWKVFHLSTPSILTHPSTMLLKLICSSLLLTINRFYLFYLTVFDPPFHGAGHKKRKGEQLKWSLAFRLYIGSFPCAELPGPVHTARLGQVFLCI